MQYFILYAQFKKRFNPNYPANPLADGVTQST